MTPETGLSPEMQTAIERRVSRDREPLKWRRVSHLQSGRTGYIERAWGKTHGFWNGKVRPPQAAVVWDDAPQQPGGWRPSETVPLADLEILPAAPITADVRIRTVLFRGHKEQVAERLAQLGPASDGCQRYVEFDPHPMAYRRWRIVYIGPPLTSERVAGLPDQAPGAAERRRMARDAAQDYEQETG